MMDRYLVQVSHDADTWACAKVVQVFLGTGSHYLAQADWGCRDGDHTAWMIVEAANRDEARQIVPPQLRAQARIVRLNKFTVEEIEAILREHRPSSAC
jgi:hypothetical protein